MVEVAAASLMMVLSLPGSTICSDDGDVMHYCREALDLAWGWGRFSDSVRDLCSDSYGKGIFFSNVLHGEGIGSRVKVV